MPAGSDRRRPSQDAADRPIFIVERFGWGAPDRLEVAGTFSGLTTDLPTDAVLTVFGEDGLHRLPAVQAGGAREEDGGRLTASFAWLEAPVAFDRARLELGGSLAVDLFARESAADGDPLPVELLDADDEAPSVPRAPRRAPGVEGAADRLRLEAQLLETADQLEETRSMVRDAEAALQRAHEDLAAERERRAADAERFREGLATVRRSAEEALAAASADRDAATAERDEARAELARAHEERDGARAALDTARAAAQELLERLADPTTGRR